MKKIRIAVLMGGRTPEYEISLITGREVVKNLDPQKFTAFPLIISRDGLKWQVVQKEIFLKTAVHFTPQRPKKNWSFPMAIEIKKFSDLKNLCDLIFIAIHGPFGEDGTLQGMLEVLNIPYTGSGVAASSLGMNKLLFKKIMIVENIPVPRYLTFRKNDSLNLVKKFGRSPFFVKPYNQGSSIGVSLVRKEEDLMSALTKALKFSDPVLIEEYQKGREVTCSILGNKKPFALPLIEIIPDKEFFDYQAKYEDKKTKEIVPARLSVFLTKKVQRLCLKVYQAVGAEGFGRVDLILKNDKDPVILEINTIPGLTRMSLVPKAAKAANLSYRQLLTKICNLALEKKVAFSQN